MKQPPAVADRQPQLWPLQTTHSSSPQLGQVQLLLPDAYVASMQLQPADPVKLGFMCGSLPVPTCAGVSDVITAAAAPPSEAAALIPAFGLQSQRAAAPRYRVLPTETDLNLPPSNTFEGEPVFPVPPTHEAAGSCKAWAGNYLSQPIARRSEALAVNALAGYGEDIDVVAPADLLKQLFKTPYTKARVSLAVHRIGRTLILNSGPDEWRDDKPGGKLPSQNKSHAQMERTLYSKFVQHSTNGPTCDTASVPDSDSQSSSSNADFEELDEREQHPQCTRPRMAAHHKGKQGGVSLGHYRHNRSGGRFETVQKKRFGGEKETNSEFIHKERPADSPQRPPSDSYLRVLFWQFQNLRMLLGSDLLVFSNENHSAVSLHLLELESQVAPLMWLDAWLDNVMASVPELAVCYHRKGVVQGYELLKTDDIFLLKGLAKDGTVFFNPHAVKENASTVLRFLQDNCKQDPGTYWLLKNAGEDVLQLFDLSVISKTCASSAKKDEKNGDKLSSTSQQQYSLPLAMLLYRLTHRLSQSKDPGDGRRCVELLGKCLEYMEEQDHLVIRASAHEHVARLILAKFKEIGSLLTPLLLESGKGVVVSEANQAVIKLPCTSVQESVEHAHEVLSRSNGILGSCDENAAEGACSAVTADPGSSGNVLSPEPMTARCQVEDDRALSQTSTEASPSRAEELSAGCDLEPRSRLLESYIPVEEGVVEANNVDARCPQNAVGFVAAADPTSKLSFALADDVSTRLAAVHYISQAIKALRWQRQLDVGDHPLRAESSPPKQQASHTNQQFPLCICGEADCVAICDFREIRIGAQMDEKLWRLMLLLGETYLSLGRAYKEQGQLSRALKAAELACLVCGAMFPVKDDGHMTPSSLAEMSSTSTWGAKTSNESAGKAVLDRKGSGQFVRPSFSKFEQGDWGKRNGFSVREASFGGQQGLFEGQLWTLVADIYVEIQQSSVEGGEVTYHDHDSQFEELTIAKEVVKEVERLREKIGELRGSCETCRLTRCSCQSDRASSGSSASSISSNGNGTSIKYGHKQSRKATVNRYSKNDDEMFTEAKGSLGEIERSAQNDLSKDESLETVLQLSGEADNPKDRFATQVAPRKLEEKIPEAGFTDSSEIFSYLRRPITADWEANLSTAIDCYANAVVAYGGPFECLQDLDLTLRKKGWACNELGRRRLAHGQIKLAEVVFISAIEAFREVRDTVNVILVQCNLGHGKRAAAEALAAKLSTWEGCEVITLFVQTIAEAKVLYGEALKFYGMARMELLSKKDEVAESMSGLWTEVHTQLAHTYLRLGMLLAREDKFVYAQRSRSTEWSTLETHGSSSSKGGSSKVKDASSPTKDAITKALELYKSLGSMRVQEAAFAQYQLACYHRDSCRTAAMYVDGVVLKKVETSRLQRGKLHASLAELYWQKALEFYQPETHPDMFLDILIERSDLCIVMATAFHQTQMMEQALNLLLQSRRALVSETTPASSLENKESSRHERNPCGPSSKAIEKLKQRVQMVLKKMLAAAMVLSKPASDTASRGNKAGTRNDADGHGEMNSGKVADIARLKKMYRVALQSEGEPDVDLLSRLWME